MTPWNSLRHVRSGKAAGTESPPEPAGASILSCPPASNADDEMRLMSWNWAAEWLCGFALQGCECTILPSGPSWTWKKKLVDAKKNANSTNTVICGSAPRYLSAFFKSRQR